ncbi:MAG TPA: TetR/AcrR family transcriptional regulator [Polyangiaceae bacterium]
MSKGAGPSQTTEQAIVSAAETLFLERGFALTSTVEIAKRAGCNQALVHYYFRSKEKLFEAIFARKLRIFTQALEHVDQGDDVPFEQAIVRLVETHFDMLVANPQLPFLIMNELATNPARLKSVQAGLSKDFPKGTVKRLERRLSAAIKDGRVRETTLIDIVITALALNVMLFVAAPALKKVLHLTDDAFAALLRRRRQENIEVVLRSLRP